MSQNVPGFGGFRWTTAKTQAAELVAQDQLTDDEIATTAGVNRRQLTRWKQHPDFKARVQEHLDTFREKIAAEGVINKQFRLGRLNDLQARLQAVIDARAEEHAEIPGGKTGLLVRTVKLVKVYNSEERPQDGGDGETLYSAKRDIQVEEYVVDTATIREIREVLKQAAQETGQWVEKQAQTDADGKTLPLAELMARYVRAHAGDEQGGGE
jgi:hypothetical protein